MSSVAKKTFITTEQYLARERLAEFKSEYDDGQICAMVGTSLRPVIIAGNPFGELFEQVREKRLSCDFLHPRLVIKTSNTDIYPDMMVIRETRQFVDNESDTLLNPTVFIEILSPPTEIWDRGGKFAHYRKLESLNDCVLVSRDKLLAEHDARQGE